jgi:branched-chain amino acid transport system substrate-binding protein
MSDRTGARTHSVLSRRSLVKAGLGAVAAPAVLNVIPVNAQSRVIKIGHVSPKTGPLAGFGEADGFILEQVNGLLAKGLVSGGKTYPVQIISKDSQSSGNRASEVASELILGDKVDLILASATPDTTNPVADQAEVNEVPCVTTNCPWQPYFFGRNGDPKKGFTWTYHFFWGLEDVIGAFLALWDCDRRNRLPLHRRPGEVDRDAGEERHQDAARRRPVAAQGRQLRARHHHQQDRAGNPRRRQARAFGVTTSPSPPSGRAGWGLLCARVRRDLAHTPGHRPA